MVVTTHVMPLGGIPSERLEKLNESGPTTPKGADAAGANYCGL